MFLLSGPQHSSHQLGAYRRVTAGLVLAVLFAGLQLGSASGHARALTQGSAQQPPAAPLPQPCFSDNPCRFAPGTYLLGLGEVIPGLQLTLPAGWSSTENWIGELSLTPPDQPNDRLFFWVDMAAVKSSGPGHGTTILNDVGTTPRALIRWLTRNPDFHIVTKRRAITIGNRIPMRTLSLNISPSANYGDPGCPGNPRCADLFTRPLFWGSDEFYGIGGDEEIRLYLGSIRISGYLHTMIVALDATDHADLLRLEAAAAPIIDSLNLPRCHRRVPGC
jgi:hypothetical protein